MFKQVKIDIKVGIVSNKWFIIVPIWFAFHTIYLLNTLNAYTIDFAPTTFDFLLLYFKGADPILSLIMMNEPIQFPLLWITNYIILLCCTVHYPSRDLYGFGIQIIARLKKCKTWWFSKCIWCAICCVIYFVICLLVAYLSSLYFGNVTDHVSNTMPLIEKLSQEVNAYSFKLYDQVELSNSSLILYEFVLPFLVGWGLCQLQMTLSLFMKPVLSFTCVCMLLLLSTYTHKYFLINFPCFGMSLHNPNIMVDGYTTIVGISSCLLIIFASIIIGKARLEHFDFIP